MPAIQMRCGQMGDKELAAIGGGAGIGHCQYAFLIHSQRNFVLEFIARAPAAVTLGIAALRHEVGLYPVEGQAIVETACGQIHKIGNRQRGDLLVHHEFHGDGL